MYFLVFFLYFCCMVTAIKNPKHKVEIPDFETLSKSKSWNPKLYQPLIYNEEIKRKAETLLPGTLEYDDFWDEMDYYCYNGYKPKEDEDLVEIERLRDEARNFIRTNKGDE